MDSEQVIRKLYEVAEAKDYPGFVDLFIEDGTFTDMSVGVTYRGAEELPTPGRAMAAAFPDMHRELYNVYVSGDDMVVVQLALRSTHEGPLVYPFGTIPATGKTMDAPCCDVFRLVDGKVQRFDCYPSGTVILSQLGVLTNLEAALTH